MIISSSMVVLEVVLCLSFGFFMVYLSFLSTIALLGKTRSSFETMQTRRFAVVVPAHNEETAIGRTVESLVALNYPRERFDVIVVADNCTDRTAEIAGRAGSIVFERSDTTLRSKGHALRWCFDRILAKEEGYDAVVVIDADSVADEKFLVVMNFYLEKGAAAVQSSDLVAPMPGSWNSEIIRFGFTLYNHVRPLARKVLHCSAGIRGNGMCFSSALLRKIPWNTYSLNEDLEYGLILLLQGTVVEFAPEAKVLATMPTTSDNAKSQRSRWERGRFPVIKRYAPRLLTSGVASFSLPMIDALIDLMIPPFVNLFGGVLIIAAIHFCLWAAGLLASPALAVLWGIIVLCGFVHVFVGLYAANADAMLYKAFFHIPRYAFWKLALYAGLARGEKSTDWVRTTRERPAESSPRRD